MHQFTGKTMATVFPNLESPFKSVYFKSQNHGTSIQMVFSVLIMGGRLTFPECSLLPTYSACFILLPFYCYSMYYHYHFKDEKAETKKLNGLTEIDTY